MEDHDEEKFIPNPPELDGVPDLSMLTYLEMPHVLHNLEYRYSHMPRKCPYTSISTILVAVNPYEKLPIYGTDVIDEFAAAAKKGRLPQGRPHPYGVSARSYMRLIQRRTNQSIIVCGESGAGKTETTKLLMRYLALTAESASMEEQMIEQQIIAASPILEAYGNAKTVLNNNSSRFGKFTKLLYDVPPQSRVGHILGSYLETYLLEKSRVVKQATNERNYHIFYFLYHGLSDELKAELQLEHPDAYHYTSQGNCSEAPGVNDIARFEELNESMGLMGIDVELQVQLWRLTIGILHLGNVNFRRLGDGFADIHPDSISTVETVARLWDVPPKAVSDRLLTASMKVNNKRIEKRITFDNAEVNRDSISKAFYENAFKWLCSRINAELFQEYDDDQLQNVLFIGILDVFGFENFKNNSLEQFCINFTNEKLQQFFNYHILQSEQEEYINESVFWAPLSIPDNILLIDMIEDKKYGFFTILDGACNAPQPSVESFIQELMKRHKDNPTIAAAKGGRRKKKKFEYGFRLTHFTDEVVYNADMFLVKNMEAVHPDTARMLKKSESPLVSQIGGKGTRGRRKQSVTSVFYKALKSLLKNLAATEPFFVRCVNPNKQKSSKVWDVSVVEHQLRSGGLVQALKVLALGYPTRVPYEMLYEKYHSHVRNPLIKNMDAQSFSSAILIAFDVSSEDYELGLTKIFFRPAKAAVLETIMAQAGQPLTAEQNEKITKWIVMKRMRQILGFSKTFISFRQQVRMRRAAQRWEHVGRVGSIIASSCVRALQTARHTILERKRNDGAEKMQVFWRHAEARVEFKDKKEKVKDSVHMIWKSYRSWQSREGLRTYLDAKVEQRRIERERQLAAEAEALKAAQAAQAEAEREAKAKALEDAAKPAIVENPTEIKTEEIDQPPIVAVAPDPVSELVVEPVAEPVVEPEPEIQLEIAPTAELEENMAEPEIEVKEEEPEDLQDRVAAAKQRQDKVHYETMKKRAKKRDKEKRDKKAARDRKAKRNRKNRELAEEALREERQASYRLSSDNELQKRLDDLGVGSFEYNDGSDSEDEYDDSHEHRRAAMLTKQLAKFPAIARTGEWFLLYKGTKRRQRPQERFVHVVYDDNGPVHVAWGAGSRHIRFDEIKYIAWGHKTAIFDTRRGQLDPNKCLSIVGNSRTVDLSCASARVAELWVKGLRRMIRQSDAEAEILSDEGFKQRNDNDTRRRRAEEGILKIQRDLFVMSHAAVFRQLENERVWLIDDEFRRTYNADVLYDIALKNDIPWKQWGDWIRQEIVNGLVEMGRFAEPHVSGQGRMSRSGSNFGPGHIRVSSVGKLAELSNFPSHLHRKSTTEGKMITLENAAGRTRAGRKKSRVNDLFDNKSTRVSSVGKGVDGTFGGQMGTASAMADAANDDDERCVVM